MYRKPDKEPHPAFTRLNRLFNFELRINLAIENAEKDDSILSPEVLGLPGFSSRKVRHFLNNLHMPRYLEVGVWQGSTFIAACYGRRVQMACAIDNFSQFDEHNNIKDRFQQNTRWLLPDQLISLDTRSFFDIPKEELPRDVDLFFYDGEHSPKSQQQAIVHVWDSLASEAIIVVDDANMPGVMEGTKQGFAELGRCPMQEWHLPSRFNGDTEQWWNGLYVALISKKEQ